MADLLVERIDKGYCIAFKDDILFYSRGGEDHGCHAKSAIGSVALIEETLVRKPEGMKRELQERGLWKDGILLHPNSDGHGQSLDSAYLGTIRSLEDCSNGSTAPWIHYSQADTGQRP